MPTALLNEALLDKVANENTSVTKTKCWMQGQGW